MLANPELADGRILPKLIVLVAGKLPLPNIEPVPPNIVEAAELVTTTEALALTAGDAVTLLFAGDVATPGVTLGPLVTLEGLTLRLFEEKGLTLGALLTAGGFELGVPTPPNKLPPLEPSLLPENMDTGADDVAAPTEAAVTFEKNDVGVDTNEVEVPIKLPKNDPPEVVASEDVVGGLLANSDGICGKALDVASSPDPPTGVRVTSPPNSGLEVVLSVDAPVLVVKFLKMERDCASLVVVGIASVGFAPMVDTATVEAAPDAASGLTIGD